MTAHTPGPWLYRGKSDGVYTAPPTGTQYQFGSLIFEFRDDCAPNDADLALVLAAPELLEELQRARLVLVSEGYIPAQTMDAAIAKATGAQP